MGTLHHVGRNPRWQDSQTSTVSLIDFLDLGVRPWSLAVSGFFVSSVRWHRAQTMDSFSQHHILLRSSRRLHQGLRQELRQRLLRRPAVHHPWYRKDQAKRLRNVHQRMRQANLPQPPCLKPLRHRQQPLHRRHQLSFTTMTAKVLTGMTRALAVRAVKLPMTGISLRSCIHQG